MTIHITESDRTRVNHLITEGVRVKQEVEDLSEGLKETVKAVAEELEIKPKLLIISDRYFYNGKAINLLDRLPLILKKIKIAH